MKFKIFCALLTLCYTGMVIAEGGSSSQKGIIDSSDQKNDNSSSSEKKSKKKNKGKKKKSKNEEIVLFDLQENPISFLDFFSFKPAPLVEAAQANNLAEVKRLVEEDKVEINQKDYEGFTALQRAAGLGYKEIVEYLISKNAGVDFAGSVGKTPLAIASVNGQLDIVKYLIEQCHANIHPQNERKSTLLMFASVSGNKEVVKYLVENCKIDVNQEDVNGDTALIIASYRKHLDVVKYLIEECKANVNQESSKGFTPLVWALLNKDLDMVDYLVNEAHANVNQESSKGFTPLMLASVSGQLKAVKCLAKSEHVDINKISTEGTLKGFTALMAAAMEGYLDIVKYFVEECNADINIKDRYGKTALDHAKYYKRGDVVRYLQTTKRTDLRGISKSRSNSPLKSDKEKESAHRLRLQQLFQEIRQKNIDEVKKQIEENPELINKKDENGYTPLIVGTLEGSLELVKFLIEKKANINDRDIIGNTALIYATKNGYTKIAEVLLNGLREEKKPEEVENYIISRNEKTETAVSLAMVNGKQDVMKLFLSYLSAKTKEKVILLAIKNDNWDLIESILNNESDIDIKDIKDDYGNNLLILAAGEGNYKLVKKLLEGSKININARNTEGYTALMRAVSGEYENIVKLLLEQQGIKISAKNNYNRTVFDLTRSIRNQKILALLESYQKKDIERIESISAIKQKQIYTVEFLKSGLSEMNKASLSDSIEKKIQQILYILSIDPSSVIYESLKNNFGTVNGWQGYQVKAYSAKISKKGRLTFAIATHQKTKKQKILVIEAIDEHYAFMKLYKSLGDFLSKNKDNFVPYVPKKPNI